MPIRAMLPRPFDVTKKGGRRYAYQLATLRGRSVAVVYVISERSGGRVLYVGESHAGGTGRAYDTITRHFREWGTDPHTDRYGRRRGGTMYDRARVRLAYVVVEPERAEDLQFELIQELHPRDNTADGSTVEPAPF